MAFTKTQNQLVARKHINGSIAVSMADILMSTTTIQVSSNLHGITVLGAGSSCYVEFYQPRGHCGNRPSLRIVCTLFSTQRA